MNTIILSSRCKDGTISFSIKGKRYVYYIDAALHPHIIKTAYYNPGKALNFVKQRGKLVEGGK